MPAKKKTAKKGPSYKAMAKEAIVGLKSRKGASLAAIKSYISSNYKKLDMKAQRFGDCTCGYPKAQHSLTSIRVGNQKGGVVQKRDLFDVGDAPVASERLSGSSGGRTR